MKKILIGVVVMFLITSCGCSRSSRGYFKKMCDVEQQEISDYTYNQTI